MIVVRRALVVALMLGAFASPAGAATTTKTTTTKAATPSAAGFDVTGAGFGHGVGMSQYGAAGFALHGYTYGEILSHYYSETTLGDVSPKRTVTVLLHQGAATFSGASAIAGSPTKKLNPKLNYGVIPHGSELRIITGGRTVGTFAAPVTVRGKGSGPLTLVGQGAYDGAFVFRPNNTGGVMTVNSVPLDSYVRGVITAEMPASWPMQALEAQAVAARTYAITAAAVAADFDVYDNTQSQMYRGISSESPTGNAAVAATSGKVVEYEGRPVVTYFFASSGGYTESLQNVWSGLAPEPWLHGVPDPYDDSYGNPYYRWTDDYSLASAGRKLHNLYRGSLEGIKVTQTGVSPRVVRALVVGTDGASAVTGTKLQRLFGTRSTYMSFTTLTAQGERIIKTTIKTTVKTKTTKPPAKTTTRTTTSVPTVTTPTTPATTTDTTPITDTTPTTTPTTDTTPTTTTTTTTTTSLQRANAKPARRVTKKVATHLYVQGTVYPAARSLSVTAQRDVDGHWRPVGRARLTTKGTYAIPVKVPGTYRILYQGLDGPNVKVP
ncbi:MAG TPA: SpoIID/LytB domain-containing protein [Solirubrobacteraceae bacterium]|nr:SpoIID/LytB domain-containing protein [Solirubrobacteraceae bacterium]